MARKIFAALIMAAYYSLCIVMLVWVNLTTTPNVGNVFGSLVFCCLIAAGLLRKKILAFVKRQWGRRAGRVLLCSAGAVAAALVSLWAFLTVNMVRFGVQDERSADCVIVLGCKVQGDQPGRMLTKRLERALELLTENPQAVCVLSGGKGVDELIPEGEAMKNWLTEKGISEERLIAENRSTSTEENLRFSAELLNERGFAGSITIVTNDFHQYRAEIYAMRAGLSVSHSSASSGMALPNYYFRELLALCAVVF